MYSSGNERALVRFDSKEGKEVSSRSRSLLLLLLFSSPSGTHLTRGPNGRSWFFSLRERKRLNLSGDSGRRKGKGKVEMGKASRSAPSLRISPSFLRPFLPSAERERGLYALLHYDSYYALPLSLPPSIEPAKPNPSDSPANMSPIPTSTACTVSTLTSLPSSVQNNSAYTPSS